FHAPDDGSPSPRRRGERRGFAEKSRETSFLLSPRFHFVLRASAVRRGCYLSFVVFALFVSPGFHHRESYLSSALRHQKHRGESVRSLDSSFFAQDTPPINASFWVERNARPLSQVK